MKLIEFLQRGGVCRGICRIGAAAWLLCGFALLPGQALGADDGNSDAAGHAPERPVLPPLQITATPQSDPLPAFSHASIDRQAMASGAAAPALEEWLSRLPGVHAQSRGNLAQDLQVSVRGHGSRSSFGLRSLRLYVDGIPASAPDGQGQLGQIDPASLEQIDVLRGPLAVLFGNASGGVLRVRSRAIGDDASSRLQLQAGKPGFSQHLTHNQPLQQGGWRVGAGHASLAGPRPHSDATRRFLDAQLQQRFASGSELLVQANLHDAPDTQDPLGLTREQFDRDPFAVQPLAELFNTRKSVRNSQLGLSLNHAAARSDWTLATWAGERAVEQFLSVPAVAQRNPGSGGGVIDLQRSFHGAELNMQFHLGDLHLSAGLRSEAQRDHRRGFENFVGTELGRRGALRRDEINRIDALDPLLLAEWLLDPNWQVIAGLRHSRLRLRSDDRFIAAGNPDDSGRRGFAASSPALGLGYTPGPWRARLAWGRGFEAPTLNELAYRADGSSGFNSLLRPARSRLLEASLGWTGSALDLELTLFDEQVRDELVVAQSSGGRSVFRNAALTRRQGAELSLDLQLAPQWRSELRWNWLRARFRGGLVDGNALPAVPDQHGAWRLLWRPNDADTLSLGWQYSAGVHVDDANSLRTAAWHVSDLRWSHRWSGLQPSIEVSVAAHNLFDARYVGSVIVNEGNRRFLETAAGRELQLALQLDW